MIGAAQCVVRWADQAAVTAADVALLDDAERWRLQQFQRQGDRARFVAATALLRRLVAAELGLRPRAVPLDRTCPSCGKPHGRPRLPGLGLHVSIAHAEDVAGVALTGAAPVGLDVEAVCANAVEGLARHVLHPDERADDPAAFFRYWTRKEAIVKATGDGLAADLRAVHVSRPQEQPQLLAYPARSAVAARMYDLSARPGYVAAVAILTDDEVAVSERWS